MVSKSASDLLVLAENYLVILYFFFYYKSSETQQQPFVFSSLIKMCDDYSARMHFAMLM